MHSSLSLSESQALRKEKKNLSFLTHFVLLRLFHFFTETRLKDSFPFYCNRFAFIVFCKPSGADGKIALVWSGLASGHLTVICRSCAIA